MSESEAAVNVFVTGQPGIGKTSLVLKVAQKLPVGQVAGFYTVEAQAEGTGERLGLDVVTLSGERAPLCRLRRGCGPKIGKYYVAIDDFERVVLPHLVPNDNIKLHIIDEVGRMALCSSRFAEAVVNLLSSSKAAVFGSLPAPRYGHPLPLVEEIKQRSDTAVLTLTKANRDATAQHLEELLSRLLAEDTGSNPNHSNSNCNNNYNNEVLGTKEASSTGSQSQESADTFSAERIHRSPSNDSFGEVYQFSGAFGTSPTSTSDPFFLQNNNFYQNGNVFSNDFDCNFYMRD